MVYILFFWFCFSAMHIFYLKGIQYGNSFHTVCGMFSKNLPVGAQIDVTISWSGYDNWQLCSCLGNFNLSQKSVPLSTAVPNTLFEDIKLISADFWYKSNCRPICTPKNDHQIYLFFPYFLSYWSYRFGRMIRKHSCYPPVGVLIFE